MEFNLRELEIIRKLLQNRLNANYDPEIDELSEKIRTKISRHYYQNPWRNSHEK